MIFFFYENCDSIRKSNSRIIGIPEEEGKEQRTYSKK